LDQVIVRPRLERVTRDWVYVSLAMGCSLLEHALGGLLAILVCSRLFGLRIIPSAAWIALGGMVLAVPIIHGTDMAVRFYRQWKEKERQQERLTALASEAELTALKAQINPHFFFNTLNTIAQLIHSDSSLAEATTERLADMFRYVLAASERRSVSLEEELAMVNDYLEIEQARFGQRLHLSKDIDETMLQLAVPSLLIQPLVENAVRHGRSSDGGIDLSIRVSKHHGNALIEVLDRGPGLPSGFDISSSSGHGLRNVDQRLRRTYGEDHGLRLSANDPQGTVVSLCIPLRGKT
jgi:two-component system sensor histidine kinase AlgZ